MKILLISAVFYPEPIVIGTMSRDIALELAKKHEVTVVCPKPTRPYKYNFNYNIEWDHEYKRIEIDSFSCAKTSYLGRFYESYSFGKAVSRYIKKNHTSFDVVYSWSWPLLSQYIIAKVTYRFNLPLLTHVQDIYPEPFLRRIPLVGKSLYKLFLPIDCKSLHLSQHIVTIAPKIKEYLSFTRNVKEEKISVVYNWQDESRFDYISDNIQSEFTFMFLGTLSGAANLEYIARTFLKANIPNSKFVFAGSGTMKPLLEKIAKSDNLGRIQFCDAPFSEVAKLQSRADILVVSLNKGGALHAFPSKLPAYMFSKKPILASVDLNSDIAFTIDQAKCGIVIEPNREEDLILAMKELSSLESSSLRKKGESGYSYLCDKLTKNVNLHHICRLIENLINERRKLQ